MGDLVFFYTCDRRNKNNITEKIYGHVGIVVCYDDVKDAIYVVEGNRTVQGKKHVIIEQYSRYDQYRGDYIMTIRGFAQLKSGKNGTIPPIDSENQIYYLNFKS